VFFEESWFPHFHFQLKNFVLKLGRYIIQIDLYIESSKTPNLFT